MLMSMLGGGATTIPTLNVCVRLPMSMLGGGGPSWDYSGISLNGHSE